MRLVPAPHGRTPDTLSDAQARTAAAVTGNPPPDKLAAIRERLAFNDGDLRPIGHNLVSMPRTDVEQLLAIAEAADDYARVGTVNKLRKLRKALAALGKGGETNWETLGKIASLSWSRF